MRQEMSGSGAPVSVFSRPFRGQRGRVERCSRSFHHESIIRTAITTHANATYGDSRSPIRADMKNIPKNPCLWLSTSRGVTARMYVQVQMSRRITRRSDWKLKSADMEAPRMISLRYSRSVAGEHTDSW